MKLIEYASDHQEQLKHSIDYAAGVVGVSAFLQWVPFIVAIPTAVWTILRIYILVEDRWFNKDKK